MLRDLEKTDRPISEVMIGRPRMFVRHNGVDSERTTLLLVHGLGDCGLAYREAFAAPCMAEFNLLVPDLPGYGRSVVSSAEIGDFAALVEALEQLLDHFAVRRVLLVGHSMGGDLTTLLCAGDCRGRIIGYVSVEGDLTASDLFVSGRAVAAARDGDFEPWFRKTFTESLVREDWARKRPTVMRYYDSLRQCNPHAFLAHARELVRRNTTRSGNHASEIGALYCSLAIPKVFCYGTESLSTETLEYLQANDLKRRAFRGASHAVMIDAHDEFYPFLCDFARKARPDQ